MSSREGGVAYLDAGTGEWLLAVASFTVSESEDCGASITNFCFVSDVEDGTLLPDRQIQTHTQTATLTMLVKY